MNQCRKCLVSVAAVGVVAIIVGIYFWVTREVVYLAATSTDKEIVATVSWNTTALGMVDSHLSIKDFYGSTLLRQELLKSRDHFADIQAEIQGLDITGDAVVLRLKRNHYTGPDRFELPPPQRR